MNRTEYSTTAKSIAFIGAGRFGKFFGGRINEYYPVKFYDTEPKDETDLCTFEEALKCDYIFLTIPISSIEEFLKNNAFRFKPGSVVIDSASVKVMVTEWYKRYLPEGVEYIFTHPLFGPDSGRNGLKDHKITMQPGEISYGNYRFILDLFQKLGLNTLYYSAHDHDRFMAYNLTFIHQLGRTLADMGIHKVELKMNGLTYLDQISTVVMNDSDRLFKDFYKYNPYSKEILDNFLQSFVKIRELLK